MKFLLIRYFNINVDKGESIKTISFEFVHRNASYNEMSEMRKFTIKRKINMQ